MERLGDGRPVRLDIRVVATTNVSLADMVAKGRFRTDLYYRLNVIPLSLPALRDRRDDIPILAWHFAEKFAAETRSRVPQLHPEFMNRLQMHPWPGNVRELANFMRRIMTLSGTLDLDAVCFDREFSSCASGRNTLPSSPVALPNVAGRPFREIEKQHLENTLVLTAGNRTHAAELLGISLRTLRNKIREYGLPPRRYA